MTFLENQQDAGIVGRFKDPFIGIMTVSFLHNAIKRTGYLAISCSAKAMAFVDWGRARNRTDVFCCGWLLL